MPFDPDAYLKQADQKKGFDPDAYLKDKPDPNAPHDYTADIVDVGKGLAKGLASPVVGAGQIAEHLLPPTVGQDVRAIPGVSSAAHAVKEFATSPNQTWGETIGDVAGEAAPWAAGALTGVDEAAGGAALASKMYPQAAWYVNRAGQAVPYLRTKAADWIGEMAARAGFGAAAGGVQATEKGDLSSHLRGAAVGGVTAGLASPSVVGAAARYGGGLGTIAAVEAVARRFGVPPWYAAAAMGMPAFWHHAVWNSPLAKTAQRWGSKAAERVPSGVTGGEAGKTIGGSDGR